jgi:hypothetical protein
MDQRPRNMQIEIQTRGIALSSALRDYTERHVSLIQPT